MGSDGRVPTGWADDRLMDAYNIIWSVWLDNDALPIKQKFDFALAVIEEADTALAKAHPDAGGSHEKMSELNRARTEAKAALA
jgi:dsDNA-specific endonuclease/ATPase MutS2